MSTDLRSHPQLKDAPFAHLHPTSVEVRFGPGFTVDHVDFKGTEAEQPVTYLMGDEDGTVSVVCEAEKCRVPGDCSSGTCFLRIELPFRCSPWQAAGALTAHLREAHRG